MKKFLFPFLGFILLLTASCDSSHPTAADASTANPNTLQAIISVADSNYVIIQNSEHPATLSDEELKEIDTLLNTSINAYNTKQGVQLIDLSQYMMQYMPALNDKGEKEVHIEGLCSSFDKDWKTLNTQAIMDGGKCFFSLTINLHSKKYTDFSIHSEA